jgi:hypothetical protein
VQFCSECLSVRPPIEAGPDRTGFVVCLFVCHVRPSVYQTDRTGLDEIVCVSMLSCPSVRPSGLDRTGSRCLCLCMFLFIPVAIWTQAVCLNVRPPIWIGLPVHPSGSDRAPASMCWQS